jgi:hypothetical protein
MRSLPTLHPVWSLLLVGLLACQTNASRSDGTTTPGRDQEIARADSPPLIVQILPLKEQAGTFVSIDRSGDLRRLEGRNLTLKSVGRAQLTPAEVASIFDLAARVPHEQRMGEGIMEGTIYRVAMGTDTVAAFIEPLMPDELRRLLDHLRPLIDRAELHPNTDWYLAGEPVDPSRRARLSSSGSSALDPAELSPPARAAVLAASSEPLALRPIPRSLVDELSVSGANREPFVAIDASTWMQLGIWGPP